MNLIFQHNVLQQKNCNKQKQKHQESSHRAATFVTQLKQHSKAPKPEFVEFLVMGEELDTTEIFQVFLNELEQVSDSEEQENVPQ